MWQNLCNISRIFNKHTCLHLGKSSFCMLYFSKYFLLNTDLVGYFFPQKKKGRKSFPLINWKMKLEQKDLHDDLNLLAMIGICLSDDIRSSCNFKINTAQYYCTEQQQTAYWGQWYDSVPTLLLYLVFLGVYGTTHQQ